MGSIDSEPKTLQTFLIGEHSSRTCSTIRSKEVTGMRKVFIGSLLALSILALTGCPDRKSIAEVSANPEKYAQKDFVVAGRVVDSYGLSLPGTNVGGGAYKIDDGTGTIWVIATEGNVPSRGAQVGVKGRVSSGVNWGGRSYGLAIYEKDRRYKKN